jgi:hypothetical protein
MGIDMADKDFAMLCQRRSHQFTGILGRLSFTLFFQFSGQRFYGWQMLGIGSAPSNII